MGSVIRYPSIKSCCSRGLLLSTACFETFSISFSIWWTMIFLFLCFSLNLKHTSPQGPIFYDNIAIASSHTCLPFGRENSQTAGSARPTFVFRNQTKHRRGVRIGPQRPRDALPAPLTPPSRSPRRILPRWTADTPHGGLDRVCEAIPTGLWGYRLLANEYAWRW